MFHASLTKWMSAAIIVAALVLTMTENSDAQEMITTSSGLQYVEHETVPATPPKQAIPSMSTIRAGYTMTEKKGPSSTAPLIAARPFPFR